MFKQKKASGEGTLTGTVMFLFLNILFFATMFIYVTRAGTGADIVEQTYSKKIALLIDSLKPGTEVNISISQIIEIASKNNYNGELLFFDFNSNSVMVKVAEGKGRSYHYFINLPVGSVSIDKDNKILSIKI